jgi:hypothetical protein
VGAGGPDVDKALQKGDLKFTLDGYKLKRLVGAGPDARGCGGKDSGKSWLLIKHRDDWSGELDITEFAPKSVKTGFDLDEILAEDKPDIWQSHRTGGGESGAMLREIVERAAALKAKRTAPAAAAPGEPIRAKQSPARSRGPTSKSARPRKRKA